MIQRIISAIKKFFKWIKYVFFDLAVGDRRTIKASTVINDYVIVVYHHQEINLHKSELPMFAAMSRSDKRAMADKFKSMERKGLIRYVEIEGKTVCVYKRDYQARADKV